MNHAKAKAEAEPEAENQAQDSPKSALPLGKLIQVPPEFEAEAVVSRMGHWQNALKPWDPYEIWLTQGISRESFRQERHHQREIIMRQAQVLQAEASWDEDRRGEALKLAASLARHPGLVVPELRRTKHGCEILADRWESLVATLDRKGFWTESQRLMALNLLDVPPELRDGANLLDIPDGDEPADYLRALANTQARRHRNLAAALAPVDALLREATEAGLGPDTPELAGLRKEERDADRRLAWYRSQFKTSRPDPRPIDHGDLPASTPSNRPVRGIPPFALSIPSPSRSGRRSPRRSQATAPPYYQPAPDQVAETPQVPETQSETDPNRPPSPESRRTG